MDDQRNTSTITVAEPWDFESLDGKNIIRGKILSIADNFLLVFKSNHMLNFDGIRGDILILSSRLKKGNFDSISANEVEVNGGLLLIDYGVGMDRNQLKDSSKFVFIGTLDF